MAKKDSKGTVPVKLKSSESGHMYHFKKNKKKNPDRLELRKYDPIVQRHVMYKEEKK